MLALWLPVSSLAVAENVRIPMVKHEQNKLHSVLLHEALRRGGVYSTQYPFGIPTSLPLSTRIQAVRNHQLDIFATMTSKEHEDEFLPIYVPLYRGMMGMRIPIIRKNNSSLFSKVENIQDLKQLTAGQGKLWSDSDILEANELPLIRELKYPNLFRMLEADRFDYFPRGIHEPWQEVETYKELDLIVDKHIMIWYTAPFYYFVHKSNTKLATHLTEQLLSMVEDGVFQRLFEQNIDVAQALERADIKNRTIIRLSNPFLPAVTPVENKALWFDPMSYEHITDSSQVYK